MNGAIALAAVSVAPVARMECNAIPGMLLLNPGFRVAASGLLADGCILEEGRMNIATCAPNDRLQWTALRAATEPKRWAYKF